MEDPVPLKAFVGFLSNVLYLGFWRSVLYWIMGTIGLNQSLPIGPSRSSCVASALMRSVTTPLAELIPRHEVFWQKLSRCLVCPQKPNFVAKVMGFLKGACGLVKNSTYTQNFLKTKCSFLLSFGMISAGDFENACRAYPSQNGFQSLGYLCGIVSLLRREEGVKAWNLRPQLWGLYYYTTRR